jgi:hypothetical protein
MKTLANQCRSLLQSLNWSYGKGEIGKIELCMDGTGRFEQKPYQCRPQWRKFRIRHTADRLTVFALNHRQSKRSVTL